MKIADDENENIEVTFLSMGFLNTTLIASGDDGHVLINALNNIYRYTNGKIK